MRRFVPVLLLLLAACQPVPRPFAGFSDSSVPPLKPPDAAGIVVEPVAGAPRAAGEALAKSLRDSDVPASTDAGNRESFHLQARATASGKDVTLAWALRSAAGKIVGRGSAAAAAPAGADVWPALAREAAPEIADLVSGDAPTSAGAPDAAVALGGVKGAPGDGGTSLVHAIGPALEQAGVAVGAGGARFALSCAVAVGPPKGGQQLVTVRWILARPNGAAVGEVSQQNEVPAGSLDGPWGDIAYDVADAAAPGIAQLIAQAPPAPE